MGRIEHAVFRACNEELGDFHAGKEWRAAIRHRLRKVIMATKYEPEHIEQRVHEAVRLGGNIDIYKTSAGYSSFQRFQGCGIMFC